MTIINTPIVTVYWPANVTTFVMFTSISLVLIAMLLSAQSGWAWCRSFAIGATDREIWKYWSHRNVKFRVHGEEPEDVARFVSPGLRRTSSGVQWKLSHKA